MMDEYNPYAAQTAGPLFDEPPMPKPGTQNRQVIDHIRRFGNITPMRAQSEYGIMRLASRINDLRQMGWNIVTEDVTVQRYGKPVTFAKYKLWGSGDKH